MESQLGLISIALLFTYAIEVWACAYEGKYLSKIDKLCKRAWKYGYPYKCISISDVIRDRDKQLWGKIRRDTQCLKGLSTK